MKQTSEEIMMPMIQILICRHLVTSKGEFAGHLKVAGTDFEEACRRSSADTRVAVSPELGLAAH